MVDFRECLGICSGEVNVWVYVLIGLGLAYFLFWGFQMRQLVTNLDKKTN
jgi:hypothetical protein